MQQNLSHEDETRFADQCGKDPEDEQIYSVCNALALAVLTQETLSASNARRLLNDCLPFTLLTLALSLSKPQTHPSIQGSLQQIIIIENHTVIRRGLHITCHILAPSSTAAQQVISTGHPIIHKITTHEGQEKEGEKEQEQEGREKPHVLPIIFTSNYADWTDLLKTYPNGRVSHVITLPVHQPCGNRPMGAITALLSHNNEEGGGEGFKEDVAKLYDFSECLGRCLAHQMKCVWEASFSMMAKVLPPQMMKRMITAAMVSPNTTAATSEGEGEGCVKTGEEAEEGEDVPPAAPPLSLLLKGKPPPPTSAAAALASVKEEKAGDGNSRSLSPKSISRLNSQTFISTATSSRTSSELPFPSTPLLGSRPVVNAVHMQSITDTTWGHHQDEEKEEVGGHHQYNNKKKQSEPFKNKEEEEDNCSCANPVISLPSSFKSHQEEEPPSLKTVDLSFSDGMMEQEYHHHFNMEKTCRDKLLLSEYACIVVACFLFTMLDFTPVRSFGLNKGSFVEDGMDVVAVSTSVMVMMKLYQLAQASACTLAPLALLHTKREWYVAHRTTVLSSARIFRLALILVVWGVSQMLLPSLSSAMTATQIMVMHNLLAHMMRCSCCIIALGAFKHRIPFSAHIVVVVMELYISLLVTTLVFTNIDTATTHNLHEDQFNTVVGHQCAAAAVSSLVVYLAERQDRMRFFMKKKKKE
jgi:hypothetical protein